MDGRYGFLVPPGKYKMKAGKGDYTFPSTSLAGTSNDALYHDLYFGDVITIYFEGDIIQKNIPLDPITTNWNESYKATHNLTSFYHKTDYLSAKLSNTLFIIGLILATLALFFAPEPYNLLIFSLYVLFIIIKLIGLKPRQWSTVTKNNIPLNGIFHIYSSLRNEEIMKKPIVNGKFYALIPNGSYYYTVDEQTNINQYQEVWRGQQTEVMGGIVREKIQI